MTATAIFVIAVTGAVTRHFDAVQAKAHAGTLTPVEGLIVASEADLPEDGSDRLRDIMWLLQPGMAGVEVAENINRKMVFEAIEAAAPTTFAEPTAAKDLPANLPAVEAKGTKTMSEQPTTAETAPAAAGTKAPKKAAAAKKAAPKKAAAKAKAPAGPRGKGKPAGKPADFKQVLKGSKRANILELMTGKHNAEAIGAKLSIPPSLVSSNIFCLHRDCGIGYTYGEGGVITAVFPTGKSMSDALKTAGAAPKAKAAAKPKAKAAAKAK